VRLLDDSMTSAVVGHRRADALDERRAARFDSDARKHGAGLVSDDAGENRLSENRARKTQRSDDNQGADAGADHCSNLLTVLSGAGV
jgi:hypothetical protein